MKNRKNGRSERLALEFEPARADAEVQSVAADVIERRRRLRGHTRMRQLLPLTSVPIRARFVA